MTRSPRIISESGRRRPSAAFTLIELVAVMVVMTLLAATALPSLHAMMRGSELACARDVERRFALARAHALATGEPAGVIVDAAGGLVRCVRIAHGADAVTPLPGAHGQPVVDLVVSSAYPGARIVAYTDPTGGAAHGVWFDRLGAPEARDSQGALVSGATVNAAVTLGDGATITVDAITGLVIQ